MLFHQHRRPCGSSSSRRGPRSVRNFRWGRRRPGGRRVFGAVISMPKDTSTRARRGPRSPACCSSRASASRSGPEHRDTVRVDAITPGRARRLARVDIRWNAVLDLHGVRAAAEGPRHGRPRGAVPIRAAPHLRFRGGRLGAVETWGTFTRTVRAGFSPRISIPSWSTRPPHAATAPVARLAGRLRSFCKLRPVEELRELREHFVDPRVIDGRTDGFI